MWTCLVALWQRISLTVQEVGVPSLDQEDLLGQDMATTPVFLPEKSHGLRSLVAYSPVGRKELDTTERLSMHALF